MAELLNDSFRQEEEENDRQFDRWSEGSRDEFWDALSSNYDYLMDDGLIATCREASSDLSVDEEGADTGIPEEHLYTFSCFMEQFRKLHDLLHDLLQGNKKEVSEDRQSVATMCRLFNEHAKHLSSRHPHLRDEIHRHLNLLNNKWLAVQATHFGHQGNNSKDALFHEIAGRMKSLRKWLREVEGRLSPVPSASSPNTLKDKHSKQTALQKEIEEKGRCVHSLRRACARLEGSAPLGASLAQWDAERVRRVAKNLEHRWHALWLSSLERQCALEEGIRNVGKEKLEASFSEEPLTKYPRLSDSFEAIARLEDELKMFVNKSNEVLSDIATTTSNVGSTPVTRTDKGIMVGDTGIAELKAECGGGGKFEIIQDVGYSSETSAHFSTDDKTEVKDKGVSPTTSYLKTVHMLNEERSFKEHNGRKSVPDTFYKMACVDDLAEDDDENDVMDHPPKTSTAKKKSRLKLERPNDVVKRSVCEWLDKYHLAEGGDLKLKSDWALKAVDTSCDASGECTNDSDSEKSNSDVNNSVAFSQSFTGSIETVIPSTTVEPSPAVRLRNKKRRPNRGRPWSVIELKSMALAPSVPHSTSEGALDTLHRSTYISSRRKKRLSLSDISSPCTVPSPSTLDESKTLLSETNSLVTTTEDQASISDQAWDEYQDPPYLSEPYSEQTIDEDEVRRLLNFGDDYRATLGSVSDGSSVSLRPTRHRSHRRVSKSGGGSHQSSDTNSDFEDFQNILETSGRTLLFVRHSMEEGATASKHAELIATTQTNLCLLKEIAAARCELESVSKEDVQKLQGLINEFEELQSKLLAAKSNNNTKEGTNETQEISDALEALKGQLGNLEENAKSAIGTAHSLDQLNANIKELQCALSQLQDMKATVLQASARVLRLAAGGSLRESATQLYQRWEEVYELNCTQLTILQNLQSSWGKPTEEELEESLETTVEWQPPTPVDITPTKAEMCVEMQHLSLGALVQACETHNPLLEMETRKVATSTLKESLHIISSGDPKKKKKPPSMWRIFLASFPFQLLLLLMLALASYTEPQCCEHANNFDFYSLKLRYLEGPPPV